ncbi:hypothetical protein CLAIMM_06805 [Cladophialophora immunda]|nr:hypothetical protein CLAIMM_06805 [Cladophialophora immunda]
MPITIGGKVVGSIGYGLMGLTWRPDPITDEQAIKSMKTAFTAGSNLWNGGDFYGTAERNSLTLLKKYFTRYPEDAAKVVINIKGGLGPDMMPDCSGANIREGVDKCLKQLGGTKSIDIFECARVDPKFPVEDTVRVLALLVQEGKIGGIGLSEVRAETIRRASKVHPIACVEVELSLWSTDILVNGVASTCAELGIPILAYSPLGRGMLTGQFQSLLDMGQKDWRRFLPRFQPGAFETNLGLVHAVQKLASKKDCSPAQMSLAWILSMSGKDGNPDFIPIPSSASEARILENTTVPTLSSEERSELDTIVREFKVIGGRYAGKQATVLEG